MSFGKAALVAAALIALSACAGTRITPEASSLSIRSSAVVTASSAVHVYPIGDGSPNATIAADLRLGANGRLFYALTGTSSTNGEIGWFDPQSHTQNFEQTGTYQPAFVEETSDGTLWVSEYNNTSGQPTIDRYSGGIGGKNVPIEIPVGPFQGGSFNGLNAEMAVASDGNIWFGSDQSNQIGVINPQVDAVNIYEVSAPNDPWLSIPQYLTMGSDGELWASDLFNVGVFRVDTSGPSQGSSTFTQLPQGPWSQSNPEYAWGISEGSDEKIYVAGQGQNGGFIDRGLIGTNPSFTPMPLPALNIEPLRVASGQGKVYFNDSRYNSIGIYDIASKRTVFLPLEGPLSPTVVSNGPIAVDASGTPWIPCVKAKTACVESISLSSTWQVFPATSLVFPSKDVYGNPLPPGMIGIGESGNSGPFAVSTKGDCVAAVIKGFGHDIQVNPLAVGRCTVNVTDAHKRTVTVSIDIVAKRGGPPAMVSPPAAFGTPRPAR